MRVRWIESQTVRESPVGCGTSWLRITYMAMSETSEHLPARSKFPTTAWSMVVKAGNPQSQLFKESLARLCSSYWYPVFVFIKGKGFKPEEARDCTQEFFAVSLRSNIWLVCTGPRAGSAPSSWLRSRTFFPTVFRSPVPISDGSRANLTASRCPTRVVPDLQRRISASAGTQLQ